MKQPVSDVHTLAAAHALNALEDDDREAFTHHLRHCEECRQDVAEFEATAARLATAVAQPPPPAVKERTMLAIDGVRQQPPRTAAPGTGWRSRRRIAMPLALAASLAAAASFAGLATWQHHTSEEHRRRAAQSQRHLDDIGGVLAASDARTAHGRARNGALVTVVASTSRGRAVVTATGLPEPASGTTYQLWLDQGGTMRPAGFIHRDGTVLLDGDPSGATALGLTREPSPGSSPVSY
ncbi:anti-sigma factor, partial [Streptomyces clavuligerus]|uniref:anti-sigma factor n=1 Tax=Streptomyces clavuligerus TaxID=1901 RepID=UPI0018D19062